MARPMKPLVRGGGYYPSNKWTPLVYNGGYTTMNGGEEPEPPTPVYWKTITGVSPLALEKALQEHIRSLTQYGKCEQRNLPKGYTQLDYIEGDGAAYIDTGVLLSNTDVFEITFQSLNMLASPVMGAISGGTSYTSTNNLSVTYNINVGLSAYSVYCDGAEGNVNYAWNGGNRADGLKHTIKYNGLNIAPMLDGVAMTQVTSHTLVENTPTVTTWLFGRNSTSTGTLAQSGVRIFDFNIQSKGHFIPAKRNSDNVVGMYDLVTGQFFTNAGTGSFTAGPVVVPSPSTPMDIWCNNGVIKYSANMANVNEQTAMVGYYISAQGAVLADSYNWYYQLFVPVKPNTSYTLSMSTPVYYVTISEYSTPEDSGFVIRKNGTTGSNSSLTITTGANTNFLRFGANISRSPITLETVLAINWMLNLGGTAMDYQPYVKGGIYTDGTPEVLTVSSPVALSTTSIRGNIDTNLKYKTNVDGDCTATPVTVGKTYRLRWTNTDSAVVATVFRYAFADSATPTRTGVETSQAVRTTIQTVGTDPIVLTADKPYLIVQCNQGKTAANINNGYLVCEEVLQTVTDIPMLLGVGDYKDEGELVGGALTHKVGVYVFDGTETISKVTNASAPLGYYFSVDYVGDAHIAGGTYMRVPAFCTHFVDVANNAAYMTDGTFTVGRQAQRLYMATSAASTEDEYKALLAAQYAAGTPAIVIYPLATETTEQTTPHALNSYAGTNVVEAQTNVDPVTLSVEYASSEE